MKQVNKTQEQQNSHQILCDKKSEIYSDIAVYQKQLYQYKIILNILEGFTYEHYQSLRDKGYLWLNPIYNTDCIYHDEQSKYAYTPSKKPLIIDYDLDLEYDLDLNINRCNSEIRTSIHQIEYLKRELDVIIEEQEKL